MAMRVLRTPEVGVPAGRGAFQPLANASLWSCAVSLVATLVLLLAFGPIASLVGIVAGEVVMTANIFGLIARVEDCTWLKSPSRSRHFAARRVWSGC